MYSLDALFGLPRKKSAGKSFRDAVHGNLFFCNQGSVDEFVNNFSNFKEPKVFWHKWSVMLSSILTIGMQQLSSGEYVEKRHKVSGIG